MSTEIKSNDLSLPLQQSTSDCCSTTEEGAAICIVPENGTQSSCGCGGIDQGKTAVSAKPADAQEETNLRGKIRSGVLFGVACLTSPCCTPLYVPLLLVLLAGTPAAVWLSANVGWVYGILTIVSIIAFVLALRKWPKLSGKRGVDTAVSPDSQSLPNTNYTLEEIA